MTQYIVRRFLAAVPVLALMSVVIFMLVRIAPGDPVEMMLDPEQIVDPEYVEQRRTELGLDQPLPLQYLAWTREVSQGNLGYSFRVRRPVLDLVAERIPNTLRLMGAGLAIALTVAIPLGIIAAVKKNTLTDYVAAVVSLSAISIPNFFLALGAIFVFGLLLGWVPTAGMGPGGFWPSLHYLILPAGILGVGLAGPLVRYVRSGLLEELGKEYIETAIAKGASKARVVIRHGLRNALIPVITVVAISIPRLLAGAVVLEQIFSWPGMGRLALEAIGQRDYPVVVGFTMFVGVFVVVFNLLADVLYSLVDARIQLK